MGDVTTDQSFVSAVRIRNCAEEDVAGSFTPAVPGEW